MDPMSLMPSPQCKVPAARSPFHLFPKPPGHPLPAQLCPTVLPPNLPETLHPRLMSSARATGLMDQPRHRVPIFLHAKNRFPHHPPSSLLSARAGNKSSNGWRSNGSRNSKMNGGASRKTESCVTAKIDRPPSRGRRLRARPWVPHRNHRPPHPLLPLSPLQALLALLKGHRPFFPFSPRRCRSSNRKSLSSPLALLPPPRPWKSRRRRGLAR